MQQLELSLIVVGDAAVGKKCLVSRLCKLPASTGEAPNEQVSSPILYTSPSHGLVKCEIVSKQQSDLREKILQAHGIICVFSVASKNSFDVAKSLIREIHGVRMFEQKTHVFHVLLLGNKDDLETKQISKDEMMEWTETYLKLAASGFHLSCANVSAQTQDNLQEFIDSLLWNPLMLHRKAQQQKEEQVKLLQEEEKSKDYRRTMSSPSKNDILKRASVRFTTFFTQSPTKDQPQQQPQQQQPQDQDLSNKGMARSKSDSIIRKPSKSIGTLIHALKKSLSSNKQ
jgi:GTPase SAR1 family protein